MGHSREAGQGWLPPSLPPTNEVCEGYVFTPVCLSTSGGGCLGPGPGGRLGVSGQGGVQAITWGWGCPGPHPGVGGPGPHLGVCVQAHAGGGGPGPGGCIPACTEADIPPPSRRYASYWNAFLF